MALLNHPLGDLEYVLYPGDTDRPYAVFLHEGLGSTAQWGRLPSEFAARTSMPTLVYSRHGYGGSGGTTTRPLDYLHREALVVLPDLLAAFGIESDPLLIGHSDGATIAAIYAARHPVCGVTLIAPHIMVEDRTLDGIRSTRKRFDDIAATLAAFHDDPADLFDAWSSVWLSPDFRDFDITGLLPSITDPVLAMQGDADAYGSLRQIELVNSTVGAPVETVVMEGVAHHPHLETPEDTLAHICRFAETVTAVRT